MDWDVYDYVAAGLIIAITIGAISAMRMWIHAPQKRLLAIIGVLILAALVWMQLAVGLV